MSQPLTFDEALELGLNTRLQNISSQITQQEIATTAGVTIRDVRLFGNNQRVDPIKKRKILRACELIQNNMK